MDLLELLRKGGMDGDVDFLREALRGFVCLWGSLHISDSLHRWECRSLLPLWAWRFCPCLCRRL